MNQPVARRVGPRDAIERSLRNIWAEVLGHRDFGVHDSFFAIGGESVGMVIIQSQIERRFGSEVPLTALFAAPTVGGAAVLLRGNPVSTVKVLVPLTAGGLRDPLFCFHPLGGSAVVYHPLAASFPDHPCYGVQALGLTLGKSPQSSLADMTSTYVDEILAVRPDGPHYLLGYSLGGWLALAAAHEIERRGGGRPTVVALGTPNEASVNEVEPYRVVGAYALHLSLDYDELAAQGRSTALSLIYEAAIREQTFRPDFPIERLANILDTAFATMYAVAEASPHRYDGPVIVVHPATETVDWARYASALTTYSVPIPHAFMLEERATRRIAPLLARHLRAGAEREPPGHEPT